MLECWLYQNKKKMYRITTSKTSDVFEEVKDTSTIERNISVKVTGKVIEKLRERYKFSSKLSDSSLISLILKTI